MGLRFSPPKGAKIILGLLALLLIWNWLFSFFAIIERPTKQENVVQIQQLMAALKSFRLDCGRYPSTEQGLVALVEPPTLEPTCKFYQKRGYAKVIPVDIWGNDFIYTSDTERYEVICLGKDRKKGGEGDDEDISSKSLRPI